MDIKINDIVTLRKKHPCGCDKFIVKRTGMDIGISCTKCGHYALVPKNKLIKNIKSIN